MAGIASRENGKKGGRPKGQVSLDKAAAREFVRAYVIQHMQPMLDAQVANSQGLKYLVVRNAKTGKFERVSKERMEALLEDGDEQELERIEVWDKDPSVQAFTDLMNRALDKPKEQEQDLNINGALVLKWRDDD